MSRNSGAYTRRSVLVAAAGGVGAGLAGEIVSPASGAAKLSKVVAKYQDQPHGQQHCGICLQFRPPGSCHIVAGTISPNGWCQFFAAKENAH